MSIYLQFCQFGEGTTFSHKMCICTLTPRIPNADIELDLFHACQRVRRTLEPGPSHLRFQIGKEFGLIFRQRNDLDETRTRDTAHEAEIEAKLDSLLEIIPSSCLTSEKHLSKFRTYCSISRKDVCQEFHRDSVLTGMNRYTDCYTVHY